MNKAGRCFSAGSPPGERRRHKHNMLLLKSMSNISIHRKYTYVDNFNAYPQGFHFGAWIKGAVLNSGFEARPHQTRN